MDPMVEVGWAHPPVDQGQGGPAGPHPDDPAPAGLDLGVPPIRIRDNSS